MTTRKLVGAAIAFGVWMGGCAGEPPVDPPIECSGPIELTVVGDTIPTISWTPDCSIGRLVVEEGVEERWGTETTGPNVYRSPIVYGINPPGASPESEAEPAQPLFLGSEYTFTAWRFFTVSPESLQLLGTATFTPEITK